MRQQANNKVSGKWMAGAVVLAIALAKVAEAQQQIPAERRIVVSIPDRKGYGIHGTNQPKSIGKAASHGCIRMGRKDLEELFELVRVGDTVEIHGERDATIAALFGAAAVEVAQNTTTGSAISDQN